MRGSVVDRRKGVDFHIVDYPIPRNPRSTVGYSAIDGVIEVPSRSSVPGIMYKITLDLMNYIGVVPVPKARQFKVNCLTLYATNPK
jgi:hypothetical protein